jgi:chaperone required for assembly of F1-ATPase
MRELFDNGSLQDPVEAARRSVQRSQRKRFYDNATAISAEDSFAVRLDDKPVRTPAGRVLAAPTLALAQAIAAEWNAQRDVIDPAKMPLTRLVNAIIDGVCDHKGAVAAELEKYLTSDLVCYRAVSPKGLVERQAKEWDPILNWASETLGADFSVGEGLSHVTQPTQALAAAGAAIPDDPWRLGAINAVTTLAGSALIALALARGRLTAEEAGRAAHVDEDWNIEQWGGDELALERRAFRFAELQAAATVLSLLD